MKKTLYFIAILLIFSCDEKNTSKLLSNNANVIESSEKEQFKLSFNFQKDQENKYSYSGSSEQTGYNSMTDSTMKQTSSSEGILILRSNDYSEGELVYKDIIDESKVIFDVEKNEVKEFKNGPSTRVVQGLNNDGSVTNDNITEFKIKMLFPITNETYENGKKYSNEISMPFNLNGSPLVLKGTIDTECTGIVNYKGYKCAKIISEIKIDESSIPKELKKNNKITILVKGEYLFDIEKFIFVYGDVRSNTEMDFLLSMPQIQSDILKEKASEIRQKAEAKEKYRFEII